MILTLFEFTSIFCAALTLFVSTIKNDCTNPILISCLLLLYVHQWITMKQKKIMRWYYLRSIRISSNSASSTSSQHSPIRMRSRKKIAPDQNHQNNCNEMNQFKDTNFIHLRTLSCPSSILNHNQRY